MGISFKQENSRWLVLLDDAQVLTIDVPQGCTDSFEIIDGNTFYWHRKCDTPVTNMRMTLRANYLPRYFQVPNVNYNGNGWGSGAQSCAMLDHYLETGDKDALHKALTTLDSWDKHAFLPNGLMYVKLTAPLDHLDALFEHLNSPSFQKGDPMLQ